MLRLRWVRGSPRSLHLQAVPAMELRVASTLASFSRTGFRNPGRPAYSLYQCCFPTGFRVAPITRLPAFAGDGSPVRTESRIFRRPWRRISGFPRIFALQCRLSIGPPGRPGFSIFRLLPRLNPRVAPKLRFPRLAGWWLFGFPRFPHLPAMPAVNFQVAPNLRSSGCACCVEVRVASNPAPFSAPGDQVLGRPSPLIFCRIRFTIPRVAPFPRFPVCASDGVPGRPVASHPPGVPHRVFAFPRILLQRPVR